MSIREASIYIHRKTFRRLYWVAKAKGLVTDALADQLLNESLEAQYPQLISAEQAVKQAEAEFAKTFSQAVNDNITLE